MMKTNKFCKGLLFYGMNCESLMFRICCYFVRKLANWAHFGYGKYCDKWMLFMSSKWVKGHKRNGAMLFWRDWQK